MAKWSGVPEEWGLGHYRDVPICNYVRLGRERHISDLKRSLTDPAFPFYYDEEAADHAVWFISLLRHAEGEWAGQPFVLEDWQEFDIVRPLFGWKRKADGLRRYRTAYIEVPRRNGKSALIGAIACYCLIADKEYGAQVYCAATREQQARIVWNYAKKMLELSPELRDEVQLFKSAICSKELYSRFLPLGRDSKTQDGFSVHCGIIDEYHAHKTSDMYDVLSSGRGSRRQPLLVVITTAGEGVSGPCKRESDYVKSLLEGTIENDTYFGFVATVDDPEDWKNPIEWQKANPNWGISIYPDQFQSEFTDAEQSEYKQASFKRKKLNIWVQGEQKWLSVAEWAACNRTFDPKDLLGKPCWGGLDLSSTRDLTALLLTFPMNGRVKVLPFFWCPKESIAKRSKDDGVPYDAWARNGFLTATEGNVVDYGVVKATILDLEKLYDIQEISFDRWNSTQLTTELSNEGVKMVPFGQGFGSMSSPSKELEKLVASCCLDHNDHPILKWMAANVIVVKDAAGNIKPSKEKSSEKIDGIVSLIMGLGARMLSPGQEAFVYDQNGLFFG